jgi:type I restriction enzyme S subunit
MELIKEKIKQTVVGEIPEDWQIKNIAKNSTLKARIGWQGLTTAEYLETGDYFLITGTDFSKGKINWQDCHYVAKERFVQDKNIQIKAGDILITKDGTIGKVAFIDNVPLAATLNSGVFVIRPINDSYDPLYCYYIFNSFYFDSFLNKLVAGSTINHLYQKDFVLFNFPAPPQRSEQTAIATALSDVDVLIGSLEKLIEKKRAIEQGAMQELLRPDDGWVVKKLNELCWFQEGPGLRNWQFTKDGMKVINVTNLENGFLNLERTERHISLHEFTKMYKHFEIDTDDIVVASSGNSYGKVAVARERDLPLLMNTSVIRFKPLKNLDYNYLLIFLKSNEFKNQIDLLITGGAQPNFGPFHLNKISMNIPPDIQEQKRIALILVDIQNDINNLTEKLVKYKMLKQSMMQQLLTGKIRLA